MRVFPRALFRVRLAAAAVVTASLALTACGGIIHPPAPPSGVAARLAPTPDVAIVALDANPSHLPATGGTVSPALRKGSAPPTARPAILTPPSTLPPVAPAAVVLPQTAVPVSSAPRRSVTLPAAAPVAPTVAPRPAPTSPPAPPPPASAYPPDHLIGPGVDVLVSPMAPYNCAGYSPPLPEDRAIIDPCAQPVTGVPLIDGHNHTNLLWNASTTWTTGTVVHYGGHTWRIVQTRVVDHYITYYPLPPAGASLQIRTCQPDGIHEWVWDLVRTA